MGGACSLHGEMRNEYIFYWNALMEDGHLSEKLDSDRTALLKWMLMETGLQIVDWIRLAEDRDR
jgi:hypothetical protein